MKRLLQLCSEIHVALDADKFQGVLLVDVVVAGGDDVSEVVSRPFLFTFTPNLDPFCLRAAFLQPQHHPTNNMDEPEPRSAKDASHVKKTLEHADDLYDAGSYQECLTTLLDLLENYHMAVLPRMKVLIMLVRYAR